MHTTRNIDVITSALELDAETAEGLRDDTQIVPGHILDGQLTLSDGCKAYE